MIAYLMAATGLSRAVTWVLLIGVALSTTYGFKAFYDRNQQAIGVKKLQDRLVIEDEKTISQKEKRDAEISHDTIDDLIERLTGGL